MQAIQEALKFSPTAFLLQVVLFLALLVIMNAIFWKPVMAHLARRDEDKAAAYRKVETTEREMEALRADYMARITQIEAEARAHIQAAIKEAQSERERILAEARAQSEATIRQGVEAMQREKTQAIQDMRGRLVDMAASAADTALGSVGDKAGLRLAIESRVAQSMSTAQGS